MGFVGVKHLFFLVFIYSPVLQAQVSAIAFIKDRINKSELQAALQLANSAVVNPETIKNAEVWYLKGFVLKEMYKKNPASDATFALRKQSLEALKTAIGLDNGGAIATKSVKVVRFVLAGIYNEGSDAFNANNFAASFVGFEQFVGLSISTLGPDSVSAESYFTAGQAAFQAKKPLQAKKWLEASLAGKYQDPLSYVMLSDLYAKASNPTQARHVIQKGNQIYPKDNDIAIVYINMLLAAKEYKTALPLVENALSIEQTNIDLLLVKGTLLEKMAIASTDPIEKQKFVTNAKLVYEKVLTLDPKSFMAAYNHGILAYNSSVELINNQSYDIDVMELENILSQTTNLFKEGMIYLEKAEAISPNNKNTLIALEGSYNYLKENEKLERVRAKLAKLK